MIGAAIAAFDLINDETRAWSPSRDALQALLDGGVIRVDVAQAQQRHSYEQGAEQMRERCAALFVNKKYAELIRNLPLRGKDE